ncbi:winged helix-turn-helix domain-containing protein [Tautonia rosea]|uniref:winged helix-turn-helix domain-containing protein n=1 Tax=Tautonia rosea TaxID=2728037 RepID=UPI0028F4208B|nr:winged helix-turn-helix domain-containing protein [Tautonia rosea]
MPVAMPTQTDWLRSVLFDRGYLGRIKGEGIKVYLVMVAACGGRPDRSVTMSLSQLMDRTALSCPTVIDSLARLEKLGLVVPTTRQRGKVKTYYVADPPEQEQDPDAMSL